MPQSATGSGDLSSAELTALILTYRSSITYASHTYTCGAGKAIANQTIVVLTTTGSGTWTVPAGVSNLLSVESIGSGTTGDGTVADGNGGGGLTGNGGSGGSGSTIGGVTYYSGGGGGGGGDLGIGGNGGAYGGGGGGAPPGSTGGSGSQGVIIITY
jgi:hypothetical protein